MDLSQDSSADVSATLEFDKNLNINIMPMELMMEVKTN